MSGQKWSLLFIINRIILKSVNSEIIAMLLLLGKMRQGYDGNNLNSHFEIFHMNS